jgi:RNA polymerase sigma-70 factor (ECF subfamily)
VTTAPAARPGDEAAFTELVAPHRAALLAHCYRMTGSLHDAEDALQDTMLRAWKAFDQFEGRSSLRTWLFTVATNACRRLLERRARRVLPVDFGPPTDPHGDASPPLLESTWVSPFPGADVDDSPAGRYENKESVELAFVAALQHLSALQRAALILREVLGFSAAEAAEQLDTSVAAVNSAVQRARKAIDTAAPTQQTALRDLGDEATGRLVRRWTDAWQAGDVDSIVAMLAADARYSMPPLPEWYRGTDDIRAFLLGGPLQSRWRFVPATANGQLAFGTYLWDGASASYVPGGLDILTIRDGRVAEVTAFLTAELPRFGLPARLLPSGGRPA